MIEEAYRYERIIFWVVEIKINVRNITNIFLQLSQPYNFLNTLKVSPYFIKIIKIPCEIVFSWSLSSAKLLPFLSMKTQESYNLCFFEAHFGMVLDLKNIFWTVRTWELHCSCLWYCGVSLASCSAAFTTKQYMLVVSWVECLHKCLPLGIRFKGIVNVGNDWLLF